VNLRNRVERAHLALLNGSGELAYFAERGIVERTVREAHLGYESGAFLYPCRGPSGDLLGLHCKGKARDGKGKRRQWWGAYADDLPPKGRGGKPDSPAKIIPFGLELLGGLEPGSPVVLCCGEEDALSARQAGHTALSQPGAGLLEPVYAKEFAGLDVVIFYDAGEEREARKDALKLLDAGARTVRTAVWPEDASHGADINGRLVEDPKAFGTWVAGMIDGAKPVEALGEGGPDRGNARKGRPDSYSSSASFVSFVPEPPRWPVLADEALHGLAGDMVRAADPHTEADPVAILASFIAAFGNAAGRGAFVRVGADLHYLKLFVALVGATSKGRKGTSWGPVRDLMLEVDPEWGGERVLGGLSSGEGLIFAVRDRVVGEDKDGNEVVRDEGVSDKRLLPIEPELAGVLKAAGREGNTLSPTMRQAWDDGRLQVMTKNSPMKATDAHVSIIGHITAAELLRHLTETDAANGFANRFLWLLVKRSKELPFGGGWWKVDKEPLLKRLGEALEFGKSPVEVGWGRTARAVWPEVYGPLSEGKPGLFGAVTGRAEAQVVRLAALYAVLDLSSGIESEHLAAALALWDYAEASARHVFGDATGDPEADRILEALRTAGGGGMTRTEISGLFGRNRGAERIARALSTLLSAGRARREVEETGGRTAERWFSC
jgi:hypothetical protein